MSGGEKNKVSVIIPTLNRGKEVLECIDSVLVSDYSDLEVVVIDNASADGTLEALGKKFSSLQKVKIIKNEKNLGAAGGRNRGVTYADGDYLLFLDSDNVIDPKMVGVLVKFLDEDEKCGMVGPLMKIKSHPDKLWLRYANINMWTSVGCYKGYGESADQEMEKVMEVGHIPNCFMVRKNDFESVGGFDEKYFIMYEESDLSEKVKNKLKKKIYLLREAVTFHSVPYEEKSTADLSVQYRKRAYLIARNRIYFMRHNASLLQGIIFLIIFNPLIFLYYQLSFISKKQFSEARDYARGAVAGLFL